MDDRAETDAARPAPDGAPTGSGADGPAPADGLGFRLRIGSLGGDAPGPRPVTGEAPSMSLRAGSITPSGTAGPVTGESPVTRADEWDQMPSAVREDEAREYRADSEVQSIISQLASQIAASDTSPAVIERPVVATPPPGRDRRRTDARPAAPTPTPASVPEPAVARATEPAAVHEPAVAVPSVPAPVAAVAEAVVPEPVVEPVIAEAVVEPVIAEPVAEPVIAERVAAVAVEPVAVASVVPAPAAAALVTVPSIQEATPPSGVVTGQQPMVAASVPASTPGPVSLPSVSLPAAALLPKIEARPGAARPAKPVDFRQLLNDSGMPPPSKAKRKKQRHPFRFLVKLILLLGLLGGGAYAGKKYYLDSKWADDIEGIADDVAERRGLEWDHAVEVVTLERNDYALHLATSMLGVDIAQAATLGGEWRAMGLAEGSLDLVAVGSGAVADQPAFYDPADETVYEVAGLSSELREVALSRALANALLDQQFSWGDTVAASDPSVALGVRALFDGDALAIRSATIASVLADPTLATEVSTELAELRIESAPLASGAPAFAVALVGTPGAAARALFTEEMAPTPISRDAAEKIAVPSDAAIFDGARGRQAAVELPEAATTTAPATDASAVDGSAPAGTSSVGVIGAANGAAEQTNAAIDETMGAAAESAGTVLDAAGQTAADGSIDATGTTGAPIAAAGSTTRGLVYWYYVLAGRIDPAAAWDSALAWRGDLTSVSVDGAGLCVSSIITTSDVAGRDLLLGALQQWAAGAPESSRTTLAAATDTEITVDACDPGPAADTYSNDTVPTFGEAIGEQITASGLLTAGLPQSARSCVFTAVREVGLPSLLLSTSLDRSLTEPSLDITAPEVRDIIARCGSE